jgi:hypothetical protein
MAEGYGIDRRDVVGEFIEPQGREFKSQASSKI